MMIYTAQKAAVFAVIVCLPGHEETKRLHPAQSPAAVIRAHAFGSGSPDLIGERPQLSVSNNDNGLHLQLESRFSDTNALLVWSYGGTPREGRVLFSIDGAHPLGPTDPDGNLQVSFPKHSLPMDQKVLFQALLSAPGDPSTRGVVAVREHRHREQ